MKIKQRNRIYQILVNRYWSPFFYKKEEGRNSFAKLNCLLPLVCILLASSTSCSIKKNIPKGQYLLKKSKIKIETEADSIKTGDLKEKLKVAIFPRPNKKWAGIRWRLRAYNLAYSKKKEKLIFFKEYAESPVLYDENTTKQVEKVLKNRAFNNGFFNTQVISEVKTKKWRQRAKVKYIATVKAPAKIKGIRYQLEHPILSKLIESQKHKTILSRGKIYELDALRAERKKIARYLKAEGYYFFEAEMLEFFADTSTINNDIQFLLKLKKGAPDNAFKRYRLGKIQVFPDYKITDQRETRLKDTLNIENFEFIFQDSILRTEIIREAITLKKGEFYKPKKHEATLRRLSNLNTFKYVSLRFEAAENEDSILNVRILLSPKKRQTIETEMGLALKSKLFITPELTLNYINRNLFKGSESLNISGSGAINYPIDKTSTTNTRYQLLIKYEQPELLSPFKNLDFSDITNGSTHFRLRGRREGYNLRFQGVSEEALAEFPEITDFINTNTLPTFSLNQIETSLGYKWQKRKSISHEFNPIRLGLQISNYNKSDEELNLIVLILSLLSNTPKVALSIEDMIYVQPDYIFNLDTRLKKTTRDNYLLRSRVALAANQILGGEESFIPQSFFQSAYFILESDFRYINILSKNTQWAFRFAPSFSFPFNEDVILPFFDYYTIGGPTSNRAFRPRYIGPGSRPPDTATTFPFQGLGNIKIETNLEFRQKITKLIGLGLFVDVGNIWNFQEEEDLFQSQFKFDRFYKQFAVGAGFGLRLDFDILLIRLDFGLPIVKPYLLEGERFVGDEVKLGRYDYRKENLQFNFAFGYPF